MKRSLVFLAILLILPVAQAAETKRSLAGNRQLTYLVNPPEAESLQEALSKGIFYGRVRSNLFFWDWSAESPGSREDHEILGIGGSILYRSASWNGLSLNLGLYGTSNPFLQTDRSDLGLLKAGKDVLSRHQVSTGGAYHFIILGEANFHYEIAGHQWVLGRQLYESVFTASNDTKMIPNTFDGISWSWKATPEVTLRAAWFDRQKLRDHTTSHDVLTFRNAAGQSWANQDDSAVHKGLSYANLVAAGENPENDLLLASGHYKTKRFSLDLSTLLVPDLLAHYVAELGTSIPLGDWKLQPKARLFVQQDEGAGAIGGASLDGNVNLANPGGYHDPESLDSSLFAFRLVLEDPDKVLNLQLGYSSVEDKADIVAPWRGFPTGGYTRAMGQYNWRANTDTFMLEAKINFGKLGWIPGLKSTMRYAWMDFDESKRFTDREILHLDFIQTFKSLPGLEARLRTAFVTDEGSTGYNEYRLEFNYLF